MNKRAKLFLAVTATTTLLSAIPQSGFATGAPKCGGAFDGKAEANEAPEIDLGTPYIESSRQGKKAFDFVKDKAGKWQFKGFTKEGVEALSLTAKKLQDMHQLLPENFVNMEDIASAYDFARAGGWHMIMNGGPGAAKTGLILWMAGGKIWMKQVHEMMNETSFIGREKMDAAEKGLEAVELKGTLAKAVFALIDEGEKANPATLATLLAPLNEKIVNINGRQVKIPLRTAVMTTNATWTQLIENFFSRGQGTTGPAFLNRLQVKVRVPNWLLAQQHREQIIDKKEERDFLKVVAQNEESAKDDLALRKPNADIDWDLIENMADGIFELSPQAKNVMDQLADRFRTETNEAVTKSEEAHKNNARLNPMPLVPSFEGSTRLMTQFGKAVRVSAALALLRSEKGNAATFGAIKKKIILSPLSIWRAYAFLTTIGGGQTIFDPAQRKIMFGTYRGKDGTRKEIDLNDEMARAARLIDKVEIKYLMEERERFIRILDSLWKENEDSMKLIAMIQDTDRMELDLDAMLDATDFEFVVAPRQ